MNDRYSILWYISRFNRPHSLISVDTVLAVPHMLWSQWYAHVTCVCTTTPLSTGRVTTHVRDDHTKIDGT